MPKTIIGVVSSDKADKTIIVSVMSRKTHPLYKKQYTSTNRFMAHDEQNDAHVGDKVAIVETRPLSARKRFRLERVIDRAPIRHVETVDQEIAEVAGQKPKEEAEKPAKEAGEEK
jgi:small subunit ribosomal protein S17